MSDGPTDATATGTLLENVWAKAYDLARAVEEARKGYHGIRPSELGMLREVNEALRSVGLMVVAR